MGTVTRARIIKIGNSQGIRIPKSLLKQSGICEEVEIEIQDNYLILRAIPQSRAGWDEAFVSMARQDDGVLFDNVNTTDWDQLEWEW